MNKKFNYRGFNFNINVELDTKVEKTPNGKRWHKVTINCTDQLSFYEQKEVDDILLIPTISSFENKAQRFIDNKLDKKPIHQELSELGFE